VFSDERIPDSLKERLRKFASEIDSAELARHLAARLHDAPEQSDDDGFVNLEEEQRFKFAKAIFLFVMALSYTDTRSGETIRDFILSSKVNQRVVPTSKLIFEHALAHA
jgi:hypothetical protein